MASSPDPNSPSSNASGSDPYAQVVNDGQATVALATSVWGFLQPMQQAVTRSITARNKDDHEKARLKQSLGPWYDIVADPKSGQLCRRPVVKAEAFRAYMEEKDGFFQPQQACQVTQGWAVFLYALGIEPQTTATHREHGTTREEKIVSWVPFPPGVTTSSVDLQLPGEVFCHVINMFGVPATTLKRVYRKPDGHLVNHDSTPSRSASTALGHFSWDLQDEGMIKVRFAQNDDDCISSTRMPFGPLS